MFFNIILKRMNQVVRSITGVSIQKIHKKNTYRGQTELQKIDPKYILNSIKDGSVIVAKSDINDLRKAYQSNPLDLTNIKAIGRITK